MSKEIFRKKIIDIAHELHHEVHDHELKKTIYTLIFYKFKYAKNEKIDIKKIEKTKDENKDIADLFFISQKISDDKLEKIAELVDEIANEGDGLGDAYETLMYMNVFNSAKWDGEYYTPPKVGELIARIATQGKTEANKVYDPTCGSGSLLIQFAKILGVENVGGFFGQEINDETRKLAIMNMILHNANFDIALGDTLIAPKFVDEGPFDAIVSNPPYSIKWVGKDDPLLINDPRFAPAGVLAPKSKADLAFVMHILYNLADDGTAAIVEFPGVLYRGNAEQKIRKYLIDSNYIDAVIQLPPNLFFGTSIATCIIVLKKSKKDSNIIFIDASGEFNGYGKKNKLTEANINKILGALTDRADSPHFVKVVSYDEVKANDYNLAVNYYVVKEDNREVIDIKKLNAEIDAMVDRQDDILRSLRAQIKDLINEIEGE